MTSMHGMICEERSESALIVADWNGRYKRIGSGSGHRMYCKSDVQD